MRFLAFFAAMSVAAGALAQEETPPPEKAAKAPVAITFTPPDLEGRLVLGIFDEKGSLVRALEPAPEDLTVDTNGYIAFWDGRDGEGRPCAAGRYTARGYVVGDDVQIEGRAFHFNDWMAEDGVPVADAKLRRWSDAVGVELLRDAERPALAAAVTDENRLEWRSSPGEAPPAAPVPELPEKPLFATPGTENSTWAIFAEGTQRVVVQLSASGEAIRTLRNPVEEPQPEEVLPVPGADAILLREAGAEGARRVRMLRRRAAAGEGPERSVSDWEVSFERSWQPCAQFGLREGKLVADAGPGLPPNVITVPLVPNALVPRASKLQLKAVARNGGTALVSPEGLPLLPIANTGNWRRFALVAGAARGEAHFWQGDGSVVEEFALTHLDRIAAFDAGGFLFAGLPE